MLDTVDLTINCILVSNSVNLLLFLSLNFRQDTGDLVIDCIHSSISEKFLKLNLSFINITLSLSHQNLS